MIKSFINPTKELIINLKLTLLSPLILFTKIVFVSPIRNLFIFKAKRNSDRMIKPSPILPHFFRISTEFQHKMLQVTQKKVIWESNGETICLTTDTLHLIQSSLSWRKRLNIGTRVR